MKTRLIITKVKAAPFKSGDETIDYFWYKAERKSDGVSFEFGSTKGNLPIGNELELDLEKTEGAKPGTFRYKYRPDEDEEAE